jgi:hypothetical protein
MKLVEQGILRLRDKVSGTGEILRTTYGTYPYKRWVEEIRVENLLDTEKVPALRKEFAFCSWLKRFQ